VCGFCQAWRRQCICNVFQESPSSWAEYSGQTEGTVCHRCIQLLLQCDMWYLLIEKRWFLRTRSVIIFEKLWIIELLNLPKKNFIVWLHKNTAPTRAIVNFLQKNVKNWTLFSQFASASGDQTPYRDLFLDRSRGLWTQPRHPGSARNFFTIQSAERISAPALVLAPPAV